MKRIMYRTSPELSDGVRKCTYSTLRRLLEAIREWADSNNSSASVGESFTVEIVEMTKEEFEALPDI